MNQHQFDADGSNVDSQPDDGFGFRDNPIRQLFENPHHRSVRSFLPTEDDETEDDQ